MNETLSALEKLMHLYSPAQVAVWLGLKDPRPIQQWIYRGIIPRTKLARVTQVIEKKGSDHVKVIRRPKRANQGAV